jgi:hypothetical protein
MDPDPNLQIILDPTGSGCTTLTVIRFFALIATSVHYTFLDRLPCQKHFSRNSWVMLGTFSIDFINVNIY